MLEHRVLRKIDRPVCPLGDKIGNTAEIAAVGVVSQLLRLRRAAHA